MNLLFEYLLTWWKKNPVRAKWLSTVVLIHISALVSLFLNLPHKAPSKKSSLLVRTVPMQQKKPIKSSNKTQTATHSATAPKKTPPPQKTPAKTTPQKTLPPKPSSDKKKQTEPSKSTSIKQKPPSQKIQKIQKALEQLEKNIAEIESSHAKLGKESPLTPPPKVESSQKSHSSLTSIGVEETIDSYIASISSYLHGQLQLVDIGEVRVQITISKKGTVENMTILSSESAKNKKQIEDRLPKLCLPLPKDTDIQLPQTFIITFCNET